MNTRQMQFQRHNQCDRNGELILFSGPARTLFSAAAHNDLAIRHLKPLHRLDAWDLERFPRYVVNDTRFLVNQMVMLR